MLLALRIIGLIVSIALFVVGVPGCGSGLLNSHVKQMETAYAMAARVADTLESGSMAQFAASASAINPGIRASAGVEYFVEARYVGLAGQLSSSGQGKTDAALLPEETAAVRRVLNAHYKNNAERQAAFNKVVASIAARLSGPGDSYSAPNPNRSLPHGGEGK